MIRSLAGSNHLIEMLGHHSIDGFIGMTVNSVHCCCRRVTPGQQLADIKHRHTMLPKKINDRLGQKLTLIYSG